MSFRTYLTSTEMEQSEPDISFCIWYIVLATTPAAAERWIGSTFFPFIANEHGSTLRSVM